MIPERVSSSSTIFIAFMLIFLSDTDRFNIERLCSIKQCIGKKTAFNVNIFINKGL